MPKRAKKTTTKTTGEAVWVPIEKITERPVLVRTVTKSSVESMMAIFRRYGQVQPIWVNKSLRIIDGHVRYRAAVGVKMSKMLVRIIDLPPHEEEKLVLSLATIGPETSEWDDDRLYEELHHLKESGAMPSAVPAGVKKKLKGGSGAVCVKPTKFKLTVICESEDEQRDAFEFALKRKWAPRISAKK